MLFYTVESSCSGEIQGTNEGAIESYKEQYCSGHFNGFKMGSWGEHPTVEFLL